MGALGLDQLTDDQLLELVQESCNELAVRDPYLRNLAQQTITTEAERLTLRRACAKEAASAVLQDYLQKIRAEVMSELLIEVANGTVRLFSPEEEARLAVEADKEAKEQLRQERLESARRRKMAGRFPGSGSSAHAFPSSGGTNFTSSGMGSYTPGSFTVPQNPAPRNPNAPGHSAYPNPYSRK